MTENTNSALHHKTCAGIAALVGATSISIVTLVALFAPDHIAVAAWMIAPLALMGLGLGAICAKAR